MTAYEIGYTGIFANRATVSAAFYVNDTDNSIFFTQTGSYRATNPPPGWPLPPAVLELIVLSGRFGPGNGLPSEFSYLTCRHRSPAAPRGRGDSAARLLRWHTRHVRHRRP